MEHMDDITNWLAICSRCGLERREHYRLSPHGYMKPVPTPYPTDCHGRFFTDAPTDDAEAANTD